jgi:hypothetical protein
MTRVHRFLARSLTLAAALTVVSSSSPALAKPAQAHKLPVVGITDDLLIENGEAFVPIDDLAAAARCELEREDKARAYEAWPCKSGGVLEVDKKALAKLAKLIKASKLAPASKPKTSPGSVAGFDPQPEPPAEFRINGLVVSSKLVRKGQGQRAYLPLAEVAKLMGGTVHRDSAGKDARLWIEIPAPKTALVPLRVGPAAP